MQALPDKPHDKIFKNSLIYIKVAKDFLITHLPKSIIKQINDYSGQLPIHTAISLGDREVIKYLIDARVDVNKKDKFGHSPISNACIFGETSITSVRRKK
jgi:ankyrin repeat protein